MRQRGWIPYKGMEMVAVTRFVTSGRRAIIFIGPLTTTRIPSSIRIIAVT